MASDDFSIKTKITLDTKNYEAGIKEAESATQKFSSSLSGVTKLLKSTFALAGLAVGTKAIVDFGKSCVQSAKQAVKTFNILDNTVKATGADAWTSIENLESDSKALSDSTNYSVTEIQKMQSVLLGFTNITSEAFDGASEAVLDMATVMGMDLTSAVQTIGKALDDPITGLDSLRRQGFKFTDEQKEELAQLVKNGKQLEAQKIILDTLAISYGGASKAGQDSFAKQRHAVENLSDTLGTKLIPLMKSFAIDNANMINSLREYLNEIDFNQIGATIKVTFDGIKKGIQNSFEYVKMIFSEIKSFMKNIDFKPIVSIINNLVSAFEKIGNINLSRVTNIVKDLKDSFSGFSENIDLTKFSEVINLIINGFVFLYEEVNKVFDTLFDNIKTFITNTWNSIKSIFEAGNKALADSETDIKSWGDYFYTIFNNLFKTVQDVIQSISYLLSGDWEIAWQYAKLVVLRIVDSVIDSMTTMITAFKDKIISILNFAQMLSPFLGTSGKVIKTALSGIEALVDGVDKNSKKIKDTMTELVEDTENKIEELTGKPADKNIEELEKFTSGSKNILGEFVDNFKEATDKAKTELNNLRGEYKATTNSMKDDGGTTYKKFSEWDSKLLQQRLEDLSEWSDEAHKINLALIEEERKKALEADKTGAETENINAYYNKQIEKENERSEKAKRNKVIETMKVVISTIYNVAKKTIEVFKKVVNTIKNVVSSGINIFKKLFDFNIDEALEVVLQVEDSILTFFVETLPKLPKFVQSVLQSIRSLLKSLKNIIKRENIAEAVSSMLKSVGDSLPELVNDLLDILIDVIGGALDGLINWLDNGGFVVIFNTILSIQKKVEGFVTTALEDIADLLSDHTEDFANFLAESIASANRTLPSLIKSVLKIINALIETITKVFENEDFMNSIVDSIKGTIEEIIKILPQLIKSLVKLGVAIMKAIVPKIPEILSYVLEDALPAIIEAILDIIQAIIPELPKIMMYLIDAIIEALPKIMDSIVKALTKIISSIAKKIFTIEFWQDVLSSFGEVLAGIFKSAFGGIASAFESDSSTQTGSQAGDVALGLATGGISTLGHAFGWWAKGTNNAPAGLSIVGEAGPELVKFRGGEQVLNNRNTNKALANMGGTTINQNVTFNNLQDTTAFSMMQQLKAYNRQMAINGIM